MPKDELFPRIINLLADLVIFNSYDFDKFLKKLIKLITQIIPVDSCLIYFYDRQRRRLILIGSRKEHKKLLGKIKMSPGEGITGWVVAHKKTVALAKNAYLDQRFKFFKELPEDRYEAFLSVPIINKEGAIGVINLQNKLAYKFTKEEIGTIEAVVKIIASAFEKTILERKVGYLENKLEERKIIEKAKGVLMKEKNLSEKEGYEMIRREAMSKRKTMKEIAEAVILVFA